jgi:hypothetical protein
MNRWNESEALGLLIQGKQDRTVNFDNAELVFSGDRFNLSPLASTLAESFDGDLTPAALDVFNISRKYHRKPKAYNKATVSTATVESHVNGLMDVNKTSITVVGKLVRGVDDGFVLQVGIGEGKLLEFILDRQKLDAMLSGWDCSSEDFWQANRDKPALNPGRNPAKKLSRYIKSRRPRSKSSPRIFTILLENGGVLVQNWCIPLAKEEGDEEVDSRRRTHRSNRIRKMQQDRNRYEVLPYEAVNYEEDPDLRLQQMQEEGANALFTLNFFKVANEARETALSDKSPKAPILKIVEKLGSNDVDESDVASASDSLDVSDAAVESDAAMELDAPVQVDDSYDPMESDAPSVSDKSDVTDAAVESHVDATGLHTYLNDQMDQCCKVDAFHQHSFFDMKMLTGLLRFCIDAVIEHNGNLDERVVAKNSSTDSYSVSLLHQR